MRPILRFLNFQLLRQRCIRLERIIIEEENICFTETHQATRVVVNFYSAVVATQEAYLSTFY
jgi:hypothetical protein